MRLPPDPIRCRQRTAADAARFPESFPRPCPAGTSGGRSRPGPSPGVSVSGPGRSAFRPRHLRRMVRRLAVQAAPADRTFRPPPQTGGSIPFRPHIPPRTDRRFRSMQAAQFRPAQTGCSTRCRQAMLRTADRSHVQVRAQKNGTAAHTLRRGRHKKTGTAAHSLRRGRHKKNGTAAHTRPRKGNRIS